LLPSGPYTAGGTQTVSSGTTVSDVTSLAASSMEDSRTTVTWTNPAGCYNDVMIIVATTTIGSVPSGNGSAYTANAVYGTAGTDANLDAGDYCVYKSGSSSPQIITGLTNGTTYYAKVFVRNGTIWSSGVEVTFKPNVATVLYPADIAIIAVNTNTSAGDEVCFISFRDISEVTAIDVTDNGYERANAGKWAESEGVMRLQRKSGGIIPAGSPICFRGENTPSNANFTIYVCGVIDDANWDVIDLGDGGPFNMNVDDQVWIMQNAVWDKGLVGTLHDASYSGDLLYGWTATDWKTNVGTVGPDFWAVAPANGTHGSVLVPGAECFNTNVVGVPVAHDKVKYIGDMSAGSQAEWIGRINDYSNWMGYLSDTDYDNANVGVLRDYSGQLGGACVSFSISGSAINHSGTSAGIWTGASSPDWFQCENWEDLMIPNQTTNVRIPLTASNHVVIDDGIPSMPEASCNNLTLETPLRNTSINNAASVLNIHGNFTNNGNFLHTLGTVKFKGTAEQTISGTSPTFYNLTTINTAATGGITLSTDITVSKLLTLTDGVITTAANKVIHSNALVDGSTGIIAVVLRPALFMEI
jgi:hypothetical protein